MLLLFAIATKAESHSFYDRDNEILIDGAVRACGLQLLH